MDLKRWVGPERTLAEGREKGCRDASEQVETVVDQPAANWQQNVAYGSKSRHTG